MPIVRPLGTMVVHAPPHLDIRVDLAIGRQLNATIVEILPDWKTCPDPVALGRVIRNEGFRVHSVHGCWGSRTIEADRVDLASTNPKVRAGSLADLTRCIEWVAAAGGTFLVVHPGGFSEQSDFEGRRDVLKENLGNLGDFAENLGMILCVENMPPGVYPGSRMADLANLVGELSHASLRLAIDTGHANMSGSASAETLAAGTWLATTHVHDNDGRRDIHSPPGFGTVDFVAWVRALDAINYTGPIMLECIRQLRQDRSLITDAFLEILRKLTGHSRGP